jgi:hypothetical protein
MIAGFFVPGICGERSDAFASRLAPTFGMRFSAGVSLLAKNDDAFSSLRINPIQHPVHRQLGQTKVCPHKAAIT